MRSALKILKQEGRDAAVASTYYRTDGEKIREMNAWLILPSGKVRNYGRKEILDMSAASGDTYNEIRVKVISAAREAETGAIFGWEISSEEIPLFNQLEWQFQHRLPVLQSRITLEVPADWQVESATFNHVAVKPEVSSGRHIWEIDNLPFIRDEPESPSLSNLIPRVGISYFPPSGGSRTSGRTFRSWADVSSWLADLSDPRAEVSEAIASKTRQLTSNARNEAERIGSIARYVQDLRYISIQTGMGRGGGYLPHAAADVFAKSYGDCKDKVALMRAMLKAAGVKSFAVAVYAHDPRYVHEEWPTPQQFNHAIVAIALSEDHFSKMTLTHPLFGRLLFFDPTDPDTSCGDLPESEQGSLALLVAAQGGTLVRMPASDPFDNVVERKIEVTLDGRGAIAGQIHEVATGQASALVRQEYHANPGPKYKVLLEGWIAQSVTGARILKLEPLDQNSSGTFVNDIEFAAESYGQLMQNRLLVFRPALVSLRNEYVFTESSRTHPVVLRPEAFIYKSRFKIPADFLVDEYPKAVQFETSFGQYSVNVEIQTNELLFTRKLVVKRGIIPLDQYTGVRKFFETVRTTEQVPVVLIRK